MRNQFIGGALSLPRIGRGKSSTAVITADTSPVLAALTDADTPADGFTSGTYTSSETGAIPGGGGSVTTVYLVDGSPQAGTYNLTAGEVVQVRQDVVDGSGNPRSFTTAAQTVTPSVALSNSVLPAITGTAEIGQTLSVSDGTWAGSASRSYSYQWTRDGAGIAGATSNTYTLVAADDGADVGCDVTADDGFTQVPASATAVAVTYAAAVATGALADQSYEPDTGIKTVDAYTDFSGAVGGTWSVNSATGVSIGTDGVVSIDTATASTGTITVTYTNSGGAVNSAFGLTISAVDTTAPLVTATFDEATGKISLTITEDNYPVNVRWQVRAVATAAPDEAAMLAGTGALLNGSYSVASTPDDEIIDITSLTHGADYTLYLMASDPSVNHSTIQGVSFTYSDVTAPTLSAVVDTSTGSTTASWGATSDEATGTIFAAIRLSTDAVLTKAEIENGTGNAVATSTDASPTADSANGGTFTGLTASTAYTVDAFQRDVGGNESAVVSGDGLTTDASGATVADAFVDANWSVATGSSPYELDITIASLPSDGGATITDIEYDVDASGSWVSLATATTGTVTVTMAAVSTSYAIRLRAVNSVGNAAAGNSESATSGSATVADAFVDANWSVATGSGANELDITIASLPANNGAAITDIEYDIDAGGSWTSLATATTGTVTVTMAAASTSYAIRLRAVNSVGNAAAGNSESATSGAAAASGITVPTTSTFTIASGTSSQSITLPASQEDDIIGVFIANENGTGAGGFTTATGSEGWTADFDNLGGSGPGAGFMYKRMGASPDSSVTIGGASNRIVCGAIVVFRGVDTTTAIDTTTVLGTLNSYTGGAITTVTDGAMVISANYLDDDDVADTGTPPSGYTMIESVDTGADDGASGCTIDLAYKIVTTAGTETPVAWTGLDDASRTYSIALRPAA